MAKKMRKEKRKDLLVLMMKVILDKEKLADQRDAEWQDRQNRVFLAVYC